MTTRPRVRVLVVDDSAFARKVLREALGRSAEIEVVGFARDGLEALECVAELKPDVLTLDLMMPNLDGIGVLGQLRALGLKTRVVVVSISDEDSDLVVEALQLGAVGLVRKPTALATDRLYELSSELTQAVLNAAHARSSQAPRVASGAPPVATRRATVRLVAVGASTGGPHALTRLLSALPADLPVPVVLSLHIPGEYTFALAKRLDAESPLHVVEVEDGMALRPGTAFLAKGGLHTIVAVERGTLVARLRSEPVSLYVPSVDVLFASAATTCGKDLLGVVLTGMGDDGTAGARAIVAAGGRVLTEAESSCVIYGMPRCVREAGYSAEEVPLEEMAAAIVRNL